jgi:hypothetical protein
VQVRHGSEGDHQRTDDSEGAQDGRQGEAVSDEMTPGYEEVCEDCPYRITSADENGVSHECGSDEPCAEMDEA